MGAPARQESAPRLLLEKHFFGAKISRTYDVLKANVAATR
jgi:hypothetical protein